MPTAREKSTPPQRSTAWIVIDSSKRLIWCFLILAGIVESIGVITNFKILVLLEDNHLRGQSYFKLPIPKEIPITKNEVLYPQVVFLSEKSFTSTNNRTLSDENNLMMPTEGWHRHPQPNDMIPILGNPLQMDGKNGTDVCQAADWQSRSYPTCNGFHELNLDFGDDNKKDVSIEFLGNGQQRDAWKVTSDNTESIVLKTLRMRGSFSQLTFYRQRVDSIVSERLSSSPSIINVYGYCGMSAMNEMGVAYDVKERLTYAERIRFGRDLASAMADLHEVGNKPYSMIAHGDVRRGNIMFSADKSVLKLHDFNQGSFLGFNPNTNEPCGFQRVQAVPRPPRRDKFSAPEESYQQVLTEKTDVYHLGSILFFIMTGGKPYLFNKKSDLAEDGNPPLSDDWLLPDLPPDKQHHTDPAIVTLKDTMYTCYRYKPQNRPTARQVFEKLDKTVKMIEQKNGNA